MWTYRATCLHVVDGDTLDLLVDLGFHCQMRVRVRLAGVNTPELRGEHAAAGREAKRFVEEICGPGTQLLVDTYKTEKYGRWLGWIHFRDRHEALNTLLAEKGWGDAT